MVPYLHMALYSTVLTVTPYLSMNIVEIKFLYFTRHINSTRHAKIVKLNVTEERKKMDFIYK